jgi:hypothetical protein
MARFQCGNGPSKGPIGVLPVGDSPRSNLPIGRSVVGEGPRILQPVSIRVPIDLNNIGKKNSRMVNRKYADPEADTAEQGTRAIIERMNASGRKL